MVPAPSNPHEIAAAANQTFLDQKTFNPWVLTNTDPGASILPYLSDGKTGALVSPAGVKASVIRAGVYKHGAIAIKTASPGSVAKNESFSETLDLQTGTLHVAANGGARDMTMRSDWPKLWKQANIGIDGDPQAQQVIHANLFYLLGSTDPGSADSIPPMGLSSPVYQGHIFWDADVWMLPALIVQYPAYAKPIVDYRFKLLAQAEKNARAHGYRGAEYPWESAETGKEEAPAEFAKERHITADVAFAAWQYYLWTGDKDYLRKEGWPLLQATAEYWASRVTKGPDGKYHIKGVLSPDETAGVVDDDAYTNAVVKYNLLAADAAAQVVGQASDPQWRKIAQAIFIPYDHVRRIIAENDTPMTDRFSAKQADTLLLAHPLGFSTDPAELGRMLDFYAAHTMKEGPAMTSSIEAVVAAKIGRAQQSLDLFDDSYQPFMRAPWDAFSEKRTTDNVYFLTGMAGCVQSVLYGFAGLHAVSPWEKPSGRTLMAADGATLCCDPHLPPGWTTLTIKGMRFHGKTLDVRVAAGNRVSVRAADTGP
jgi:trehalose/maltose hydrolase-like predicted phosphorylase